MGILSSLFAQTRNRDASSDYWYMPVGSRTKAGVQVGEDQVLKISAVLQGVRFLSQTVAGLPRFIFRHLEDGRSREKEVNHPLNRILRYQPNAWQTSFQFVETMTANAMLSGIAIAERVYDEKTGALLELRPLDSTRIVRFDQQTNGKIRYIYRNRDGSARTLFQEDLFALPGFGINGIYGLPLIEQMRETAGLALATESYGADFFANSAMPRLVLTSPKVVGPNSRNRMKADWESNYGGQQHGTALLEEDTKVNILSTKNDEAQFIETKKFLIAEFSRHLDVTPHRLSDLEKSSYNNVEQMSLETVVYSLTPWVRRWEQCSYRDLLTEDDKEQGRYVEFILEGLLRGDTAARAQFYQSGVNTGWLTRNEVRERENLNPLDGLDDPLQAQNQMPVGEMPNPDKQNAMARAAAERVVRREANVIAKWKERKNGNIGQWRAQVKAFYGEHVAFVQKAMAIELDRAKRYCSTQCRFVLSSGPDRFNGTFERWYKDNMIDVLVREAGR